MTRQPGAPQGAASPYSGHIPALDGVRGLAILGVMGTHLFFGTARSPLTRAIALTLDFGAHGVDLFFVLSGFLITGILYESRHEDRFFRTFYARRMLRIFPLYYLVLALFGVASLVWHLGFGRQLLSLALYLQNTNLVTLPIYSYQGPPALPLSHFWTLAIEEQFYLVWPLAVFWLRSRRPLLRCCAVVILLCPLLRLITTHFGIRYEDQHANVFCRADSLILGGALALLLRSRWHNWILRYAVPLFLGGLALYLVPAVLEPRSGARAIAWLTSEDIALGYTWLGISSAGLIAFSLRHGAGRSMFSTAPLRWLGRYSYGIYVIHKPLFEYLQMPLHGFFAREIASKGAVVALTGFSCAALSMSLAWLSFRFFESRFLRMKRHFAYLRS